MKISMEDLQLLLDYLQKQPYHEVYQLIAKIMIISKDK